MLLVSTAWWGCAPGARHDSGDGAAAPGLTGQWRSHVQFADGPFAAVKDLEFMYAIDAGGTLTESSNYDGAPPVPPAYGIWRMSGPGTFELKYEFYMTKAPAALDEIAQGGGWMPAGRGVLTETVTLAADGGAFTSTLRFEAFDVAGQPVAGGGEAVGRGVRLTF